MSHFYRGMIFLPCGNVYLCRLNKETDTGMETKSQNLKDKLYMWYKVRELQSKGLNKTQIGKYLGEIFTLCGGGSFYSWKYDLVWESGGN